MNSQALADRLAELAGWVKETEQDADGVPVTTWTKKDEGVRWDEPFPVGSLDALERWRGEWLKGWEWSFIHRFSTGWECGIAPDDYGSTAGAGPDEWTARAAALVAAKEQQMKETREPKPKPAAASAWEEWMGVYKALPFTTDPPAKEFDRWVAAREKAAVEAWNRSIFPITATHPSGALSVKVHIEDGNCVVATTDAKPLPKPDAGRAEGKTAPLPMGTIYTPYQGIPAPKPRRAPEVVAEAILSEYKNIVGGHVFAHFQLKDIIAAAVRADRGEG